MAQIGAIDSDWELFVAKNVVLSGVKAVTIHDTNKATVGDLTAQVYHIVGINGSL